MYTFNMQGTKWRIFSASIDMFSEKNFHTVSMKEIAQSVAIKPASIYNHFVSKDEILTEILRYYEYYYYTYTPRLEVLLEAAETETPMNVFMQMQTNYPKELRPIMEKCIKIFLSIARTDERAYEITMKTIYELPHRYIKEIIYKLTDLGKIRPIDTETLETLLMLYSGYALHFGEQFLKNNRNTALKWQRGMKLLFSTIL